MDHDGYWMINSVVRKVLIRKSTFEDLRTKVHMGQGCSKSSAALLRVCDMETVIAGLVQMYGPCYHGFKLF